MDCHLPVLTISTRQGESCNLLAGWLDWKKYEKSETRGVDFFIRGIPRGSLFVPLCHAIYRSRLHCMPL